MPGTSTPNPSDPDPSGGGENADSRKRLKLKRIGPHVKKPDPAPSPPSKPAPPPRSTTPEPSPPPPPKAGPSPARSRLGAPQVALFAVPLFLVLLILFLITTILQPPSAPEGVPTSTERDEPASLDQQSLPPPPDPVRTLTANNNPGPRPELDLETFLNRFNRQELTLSSSPRGLFAGPLFIPEGTFINRDLGLVLERVQTDSGKDSFTVTTDSGSSRSFTISSTP